MSATNRGGLARHEHDFYETPSEAIDVLIDALGIGPEYEGYVVDAGCGNGAIARRIAARAPLCDVRGVELQPELLARAAELGGPSVAWEQGDWLAWQADGQPDLIVSNPPYQKVVWDPNKELRRKGKLTGERGGFVVEDPHLAERFIRKALSCVSRRGTVAMLLRSNYFIPACRRPLREEYGSPDLYGLEKRPSFNGSGTDATDYVWAVWGPRRGGKWFVI